MNNLEQKLISGIRGDVLQIPLISDIGYRSLAEYQGENK
jgi:hypothetical protein